MAGPAGPGSERVGSTAAGQPTALAGTVLLSAGQAGTAIKVRPLALAVVSGSLQAQFGCVAISAARGAARGTNGLR